jgi:hypothetical protein
MADESNEPVAEDELPPDVVSPLEQMAIVTHETYVAFVRAGFKENQALALTMKTLEMSIMNEYSYQEYEELDLDEDE